MQIGIPVWMIKVWIWSLLDVEQGQVICGCLSSTIIHFVLFLLPRSWIHLFIDRDPGNRARKMDAVATEKAMDPKPGTHWLFASFALVFLIWAIGKKRARQEAGEDRPSPTKKAKNPLTKETAVVPKKTKPSAPSKANGKSLFFYKTVALSQGAQLSIQSCSLLRNGRSKIWSCPSPPFAQLRSWPDLDQGYGPASVLFSNFMGFVWPDLFSKSREELFAILPEMTGSKCINGISWKLFETPMILLDDKNEVFQVVRDAADNLSLEVSM